MKAWVEADRFSLSDPPPPQRLRWADNVVEEGTVLALRQCDESADGRVETRTGGIFNGINLNAAFLIPSNPVGGLIEAIQCVNAVHSATVNPNASTPPGGVHPRSFESDKGSPRVFLS